jgi:NADP-dependent 3-hydroxy acid dehydrogenase YdfG
MTKIRFSQIMARTACLATLLLIFMPLPAAADSNEQESAQKAVLITGASSGIGLRTAELLASKGYFVYAGARKQKDMDALNALDNVQAVRLDVTVQEEIDAAVETVRKGGRGLYGLVNNAGVFTGGPLIETDIGELQWLFDVNVYGIYRVTQAFAPLIIESQGCKTRTQSMPTSGQA